jgi:hypothetical protein
MNKTDFSQRFSLRLYYEKTAHKGLYYWLFMV